MTAPDVVGSTLARHTSGTTDVAVGAGAGEILLHVRGVTKTYPGVWALDAVDFDVRPGEIHGLVGENGAGKSTLVRIIGGAIAPDSGQLFWRGSPVQLSSPHETLRLGIGVMYQERNLVPFFSGAENILLGREEARYGFVRRKELLRRAEALAERLRVRVDLRRPVSELSPGQQQVVEILRLMAFDGQLLILDEPTASLGAAEARELLRILRELRAQGAAIVYVSHHLDEVLGLCDRVTVLRDGRKVVTEEASRLTRADLIRHMVNRSIDQLYPKQAIPIGAEVFRVESLVSRRLGVGPVSLHVRQGEIVGMAGLVGSGRTEFVAGLFTGERWDQGRVLVDGKPVQIRSVDDAVRAGIVLVPEGRHRFGLVLNLSVLQNLSLASLPQFSPAGIINRRAEERLGQDLVDRLRIRITSLGQAVTTLSGGNQQKVSVGKWLTRPARLYIFDEPTQGIDVQAKTEIYRIMQDLAAKGAGVLFVSSDLPELLGIADRIVVMNRGSTVAEFERDRFDAEAILAAAMH
ncbi:MAG TPA: sugar ABC transporter ATP-binding protein [Limnochordales bacterium]